MHCVASGVEGGQNRATNVIFATGINSKVVNYCLTQAGTVRKMTVIGERSVFFMLRGRKSQIDLRYLAAHKDVGSPAGMMAFHHHQ